LHIVLEMLEKALSSFLHQFASSLSFITNSLIRIT